MSYQSKLKLLTDFIELRVSKCEQRSEMWHKLRCKSFGGSEIASLMGQCNSVYINQSKFMQEKASKLLNTFQKKQDTQQILMDWGTFFEPVHRTIMEKMFETQIIETSLAQGIAHMKGCHQSPDGVSVIDSELFLKHVTVGSKWRDLSVFDQKYLNVLFEQKSPARRDPDGQVPRYYIGQVKLGLEIFDVCDVGCYTESVFLVCNMRQMFNKSYNKSIIKKRHTSMSHPNPIYIGIIEFDDQWFQNSEILGLKQLSALGDISSVLDERSFCALTEQLKNNNMRAKYHCFEFQNNLQLMADIQQKTSNMKIYMCWKLVKINFTAIEKSAGFGTLTGMFVNLGQLALDQCATKQTIDNNQFDILRKFGELTVDLQIPLTPQNDQDDWFVQNKQQIVQFFEKHCLDTWEGLLVLVNALLIKANEDDVNKAQQYIQKACQCCENDMQKKEQYSQFLDTLRQQNTQEILSRLGLDQEEQKNQ